MNFLRKTLVLAAVVLGALVAGGADRYRRVTVVHTNDLHGHVENASTVAAIAARAKAANPRTLFLDAGDQITGTPLSTLYKGKPIFEVFSLMGYDAAVIGNHEFDHGWREVRHFAAIAGVPMLCANAKDPDGKPFGDAPYKVFDLDGVRVGVIGLTTDKVPELTVKSASEGCSFEDPVAVAKRLVPEVRKLCDVVVLLTHLGLEEDGALAGAVPGIDLIVGGHTHTTLKEPVVVGTTRIVQAARYGTRVGIVELYWDTQEKRISNVQGHLVRVDPASMPRLPLVQQLVDDWESKVSERMDVVIGTSPKPQNQKQLRRLIERIYRDELGTDFGYQNLHGIRAKLDAGEITVREVWTMLPFDNTLVRMTLKGTQLPKYMRERLGTKYDAEKDYVIGTNSYVADQQKKYFRVEGVPVEGSNRMMRNVVVDWVRRHGGFEPRKEPK